MTKTFYFNILKCPNCKCELQKFNGDRLFSGTAIIEEEIKCPSCNYKFSYDDGFIEFLADKPINLLFQMPIYSGVVETDSFKIRVGKTTKVRFKNLFREIYRITFPRPVDTSEKLFEQIIIRPFELSKDGFVAVSSSLNDSLINQEIKVAYAASGRDFTENLPIWHRFLQSAINSIDSQQYGMAIVDAISAFDAFLDEFLMNQLMKKRGYSLDCVKQLVRNYNRHDKLFYFLSYVTGKSFEDSPYNEDLKDIADLRNKIVHPKKYEFKESDLIEENAMKALETVIKSIKWVNDTK